MKDLKKYLLPAVAALMFVLTLIVLTQVQGSYSAAVPAFVTVAETTAPLKTGYEMAFDLGTTNHFAIIPIGSGVALALIGVAMLPQAKKHAGHLMIAAGTIALFSAAIYFSNIGSGNYLATNMDNAAKLQGVAELNFKVNGTGAYYVGIISQLVAFASLVCYVCFKQEK